MRHMRSSWSLFCAGDSKADSTDGPGRKRHVLEDVEGPCDTSAGRASARRLPAPACRFLPPDIYENSCTLSSGEGQAQSVSFTFGN